LFRDCLVFVYLTGYLPKGLTEKILSQRDRIEGECKQVTVMFCDMEEFTALSEKLGIEAVPTAGGKNMKKNWQRFNKMKGRRSLPNLPSFWRSNAG